MHRQVRYNVNKIYNRLKLLSIELGIVLLSFFISFFLMVYVIRGIFLHKKEEIDFKVFDFLRDFVSDTTTSIMNFFTFFGGQYFLIPANLILILWAFFIKKDKWFGIRTCAVSISSLILMFALKQFFQRPRPLSPLLREAKGLSFPSGHAFMSFAFFGLLIYVINKNVKVKWLKYLLIILSLIMILMIGTSRVYLRVHYASDVLAGYSMGLMWLVISLWVIHIIENHKASLPPVQ